MSAEIVVPPLGESITEATIARWHKNVGELVKVDEVVVELETDKITMEVSSAVAGTISEIRESVGTNVKVGQVLGIIQEGNNVPIPTVTTAAGAPVEAASVDFLASPAAAKIAAENNINLADVKGTSKGGRITKGDVLNVKAVTTPGPMLVGKEVVREEYVKMSKLRKTIAKRLKDSQNTAAILSTFNEIDMYEVIKLRQTYQEKFQAKHGVKLGFMSFFVKAVVHALMEIPVINAEISGDEEIIYKRYYDIGVAVGTDQGLVVPIVRDADTLSLAEIEKVILKLGKQAKEGKLSISEISGGTFSITNGGIYGSLLSTPIINPPQSGILGMHNIVERPCAIKGQVVIRPMMYVALSYDHRIVDGKEAVTFLVRVKEMIESPDRMLLGM